MRTGLVSFQMPTNTGGVNGGRYTLEKLAQDPTYAAVVGRIDELSGTYADGARTFLPPAVEAAESMLTPEQTAQLCDDTFTHIGLTAFQAFERYPDIFRAARGRLKSNHIFTILDKLTKRSSGTLPFHGLAKAIESMQGCSSGVIADVISSGIHADGSHTSRIVDRIGPAFLVSRLRFSSDEEAVRFFRLTKKRFGTRADQVIRSIPGLLSGIDDTYSSEQIIDAITRPRISGLSPAANAAAALYKIALFKAGEPNPDLEVEKLIAQLRAEGELARKQDLPTMGGKIGGDCSDFDEMFFPYLTMLGFEHRPEIIKGGRNVCETCDGGHMLVLPAARSAFETSILVDMLRDAGVFRDGAVLRHQITVEGRLVEDSKYIALALHSAQPIRFSYPRILSGETVGIKYLAPVVEGGWALEDINRKGSWTTWRVEISLLGGSWGFDVPVPRQNFRFDLPLLSIYVLVNESAVLEQALRRSDAGRSSLEQVLVGVYRKFEERWKDQSGNVTSGNVFGKDGLIKVDRGEGHGAFFIKQSAPVEIAEEFFEALERAYGEELIDVRANHNFNIYATQFLAWAMQSPYSSKQNSVFREFKSRMHALYRRAGIESTLKTRWKRSRWEQIYPSLSQLDAIKDPEFHNAVRTLVVETVNKLQKMV